MTSPLLTLPSLTIRLTAILAGLLLASPLWANNGTSEADLKHLRQQIHSIQGKLDNAKDERTDVQNVLKESEKTIGKISSELRKTINKLKHGKQELKKLKSRQQELQADKRVQSDALTRDIRAAYTVGRQETIKLLLNQQEPEKVSRLLRYYDYFHQSRFERIESFNHTLKKLDKITTKIHSESLLLKQLQNQLGTKKQKLLTAQSKRKQTITLLNRQIKDSDAELDKLLKDERRLQQLLDAVDDVMADLPDNFGKVPFASMKGKLIWPAKGTLSARFGTRRAGGRLKWNGVIIAAKEGINVKAIHHGRVVYSDWLRGFGLITIIDHGDGYISLYGHNQSLFKEIGDWVSSEEAIATVGNSGGRQKAGLYFEVRRKGKPNNPKLWCKKS